MDIEYWIIINDQPTGPFTHEQLRAMPGFTPDTEVWYESLTDWIPASQIATLADLFDTSHTASPVSDDYGMPPIPDDSTHDVTGYMPAEPRIQQIVTETPVAALPIDTQVSDGILADTQECVPDRPGNYLVWSILSVVLFFFPTGLAALFYSIRVNINYKKGRYAKSLSCSERAQWWIIISIVLGFMTIPLRMLFV